MPSGPPPSGIARRAERARAAARAQPTTQAWVPEHRQPSVRGGLPAEIAERVEAVDIVTPGLDVVLRPYQEFGTAFALLQKRVVLGDEMGLGKTIEALALVAHLAAAEGATRFVVVAPASIVGNWHLEATGRLDTIAVHLAHGPARRHAVTRWVERGGVLLTSYTTLRSIEYDIAGEAIDLVVGDEAHYLKNPDAQRTRATARVMGNAERVLLMTGTPMENRADEFVNLVRLLDGARADALTDRRFATPTVALDFRRDVAPVYLRRNQEDVLHELPDRIESIEWIDLGHRERQQYWDAVETSHIAHVRRAVSVGLGTESAKLRRLRELLDEYRADGQRVIVFSFFLDVLDAVEEMAGRSWRIDGSVPPARRMDIIAEFSAADPYGGAVMVSQISAGGIGVNLQAASAVIIVEPQYKPTTEWQAIARAHRMGQTRPVHVHRLIARDTVDESLMSLLATKEQRFDDYARESTVKDSSAKAVATDSPSDTALSAELMRIETERRAAA